MGQVRVQAVDEATAALVFLVEDMAVDEDPDHGGAVLARHRPFCVLHINGSHSDAGSISLIRARSLRIGKVA